MKRRDFFLTSTAGALTVLRFGVSSLYAQDAVQREMGEELTADQIVQMVHMSRVNLNKLPGELTKDGLTVPFEIVILPDLIRFNFSNPAQIINLNINEKGARLLEATAGSNREVPLSRYSENVRGTDLNYDDISMRYLYWSNKKKIGTETIKTRRCFVVDLYNPKRLGDYYLVRIFVDRESGALMRVQSYDWNGKLIKVCAVTAGQKVDAKIAAGQKPYKITVLKTMDVTKYRAGTKEVESQTQLELKKG